MYPVLTAAGLCLLHVRAFLHSWRHKTSKEETMPLQVDNRVSLMDIFSILIGVGVAASVFFGVAGDVSTNNVQIAFNKEAIHRVEVAAKESDNQIVDLLEKQNWQINEIKDDSAKGRKRIEDKLDKIIERELNGR